MKFMRTLLWFIFFASLIVFTNLGYILTALSDPPLVYTNIPFPLERKVYYPGDTISFDVKRCVYSSKPIVVTITRHFVNIETDQIITLNNDFKTLPAGCTRQENVLYSLMPENMSEGFYKMEGVNTARVEGQSFDILWETEVFEFRIRREV